jgi:hypothetical protein
VDFICKNVVVTNFDLKSASKIITGQDMAGLSVAQKKDLWEKLKLSLF